MKEGHVALYRRHRPSNFDEVLGQEQLVDVLKNSIKQKKISHAYLFYGGRGTGKTTVARIVARDIGCNNEDIIEIDAASNRGIDEIRELREAVRTSPFSSPYKVYIVDEAHMLTKEAANALLKTLEEPPKHVIFILATTDAEKLPQTIVSRCQKIAFKQADIKTLSGSLTNIAKKEGYKLEENSATLIARHSHGSYRDSLGILEQIIRVSDKKIDHKKVEETLGAPDREILIFLLEGVCKKDNGMISSGIKILEERNGVATRIYDEFIQIIRESLLIRIGEKKTEKGNKLADITKEHPRVVSSKMLLELLENRHLVEVSESHGFVAFLAILSDLVETTP